MNTRLRTVVLVDYQNMYRSARRAFGWESEQGHFGNFRPVSLGRCLGNGPSRQLKQARVYTGIPTPKRDRHGNQIMQRRIAGWVGDNPSLVEVFPRPLSYDAKGPREKGVDVELAIDLVTLAMDNEFDIAVVASMDTDLLPPIKLVLERFPDKLIETVGFEPIVGCEAITAEPLQTPGELKVFHRHKIPLHQFDKELSDRRNFVQNNASPQSIVGKGRWDKISRRFAA